jgi:hypothetical protein
MAIVVVGGSGRGVGKTALVCGLIAALPEFHWTAVKITSHAHGLSDAIFEESQPGQGSDTARYLAAGARRSVLLTASEDELGPALLEFIEQQGPAAHTIVESNTALRHLRADLCLAIDGGTQAERKPSFDLVLERMDAMVAIAERDDMAWGEKPVFHLAALDSISPPMLAWLRERLPVGAKPTKNWGN